MATKKKHALLRNEQVRPTRNRTASALYLVTGLGALTTAVGMMLCGKRNRALLIAQWVAPLLITAADERLSYRKKQNSNR